MFVRLLQAAAASLSVMASVIAASAQPCTPTLVGLPTGPQHLNPNTTPAYIYDLTRYDDASGSSLLACGIFLLPPVNSNPFLQRIEIARFQHGQWTAMDAGLPTSSSLIITSFAQIALPGLTGTSLYAAGNDGNVYRWNESTSTWSPAALGLPLTSTSYPMLLAHEDALGPVLLVCGGYSSGVMAWRGSGNWTPYAPLTISSGTVQRIRVIDEGSGPTLFALGNFRDVSRNLTNAARLVNGAWQQYSLPSVTSSAITDITVWDDGTHGPETYVTGSFCTANGCNIARFRDGAWQAVLGGVSLTGNTVGPGFFKIDQGSGTELYLAGPVAAFNQFSFVGRITPAGWQAPVFLSQPPGASTATGGAACMLRYDDGDGAKTYIGGLFANFRHVPNSQVTGAPAYGLVRGNDGNYESLAQGLGEASGFVANNIRYDLCPINIGGSPKLFAGGPFIRAGGLLANGAALFDGQQWSPLSMPTFTTPTPAQGATVAPIDGLPRIVVSTISSPVSPVAYWNGTDWIRLNGSGPIAGSPIKLLTLNNELYALTVSGLQRYSSNGLWQSFPGVGTATNAVLGNIGQGERIYVTASGSSGTGVYEFNGSSYARIGAITGSIPQTLVIHNDGTGPKPFVAGSGIPGFVARVDATQLTPLGMGLGGVPTSLALASFDDGLGPALYAAGTFTIAGGVTAPGLAKWQNGAWRPVPSATGTVASSAGRYSMAVFNDRLYIAGEFLNIGLLPADHLAYIEACPRTCTADFNGDGDSGTDADIEAFFACLAGSCCPRCTSDFNADGDLGTDADIESFFRVLAGNPC